jgi:hypothetical protein
MTRLRPLLTAGQAWLHAGWLLALTAVTATIALVPARRPTRLSGALR